MKSTYLVVLSMIVAPTSFVALAKTTPDKTLAELNNALTQLSTAVSPTVVEIMVEGFQILPGQRGRAGQLQAVRGSGSGVLVTDDGYIVTNYHVVRGADRIEVSVPDSSNASGRSIVMKEPRLTNAEVIGIDVETDLAVLKIQGNNLPAVSFGNSDNLAPGQLVFAFGSPRGLQNSMSMGIVSAVGRQLGPDEPMIYVQTDASINPGNSGGPLVNMEGEVVGINTAILSRSGGSEGIGFAAPSNVVSTVYQHIRKYGEVKRGTIGTDTLTITRRLATALKLAHSTGVVIEDAYPDGPAGEAGLLPGDIILTLDDKPMENARQFDVNVYLKPIGKNVTLEVMRGDRPLTFQVPVLARPKMHRDFEKMVDAGEQSVPELSIIGVDLTPEIASLLPRTRRTRGVAVVALAPNAAPEAQIFRAGDVIYSMNGEFINNLRELRGTLERLGPRVPKVLQVERRGRLQYLLYE